MSETINDTDSSAKHDCSVWVTGSARSAQGDLVDLFSLGKFVGRGVHVLPWTSILGPALRESKGIRFFGRLVPKCFEPKWVGLIV